MSLCPRQGKSLQLEDDMWEVRPMNSRSAESIIENSLPWKLDALCNIKEDEDQCYEIDFHGKMINVCVSAENDIHLSDAGEQFLQETHKIVWTKRISAVPEDKQLCHSQQMIEMDGVTITSYVDKGDADTCESILEDASRCDDCDVTREYPSENTGENFECVLDTAHINEMNKSLDPEFQFVRDTTYDCKDNGWKCSPSEFDTHEIKEVGCRMSDDCHKNIEFGICDFENKTCKTGASNSGCNSHEDCDVIYSKGQCKNDFCASGQTTVQVTYYKPSDINCQNGSQTVDMCNRKNLYEYCGKITDSEGNEKFSGYCTNPVDNNGEILRDFKTCKPFLNQAEINQVISDENDYDSGCHRGNFHSVPSNWENLTLCQNVKVVDGRTICKSTMDRIDTKLGIIKANTVEQAQNKCDAEYPNLTVKALRKF